MTSSATPPKDAHTTAPQTVDEVATPAVLVARERLEGNISRMQRTCDDAGVELWPHVKAHKITQIAELQLGAGAQGITCAKVSEAEAMLASGVRSVFIAYPLVDVRLAPRLASLADAVEELVLACTSEAQAVALEAVVARAGLVVPVLLAVDSGLGREGVRSVQEAQHATATIARQPHLRLRGLWTHEGHAYGAGASGVDAVARQAHERLLAVRDAIGGSLDIWPGCSATATRMAYLEGVTALRPGSYVFGDLALITATGVMSWHDAALSVLTTVVDRPEPGLALLDAGTKTLSGDKDAAGHHALLRENGGGAVTRANEEHAYLTGPAADAVSIGDRVHVVPAHACPVLNLAEEVVVLDGRRVVDVWPVAARGKVA